MLDKQEFNRSKQFPSPVKPAQSGVRTEDKRGREESKEEAGLATDGAVSDVAVSLSSLSLHPLSVEELMDEEFGRIIGHEGIKQQLRQFYKKVQLDRIRAAHGKERDSKRLYHMIFSGPPGTGQPQPQQTTSTTEHSQQT